MMRKEDLVNGSIWGMEEREEAGERVCQVIGDAEMDSRFESEGWDVNRTLGAIEELEGSWETLERLGAAELLNHWDQITCNTKYINTVPCKNSKILDNTLKLLLGKTPP